MAKNLGQVGRIVVLFYYPKISKLIDIKNLRQVFWVDYFVDFFNKIFHQYINDNNAKKSIMVLPYDKILSKCI